VQFLAGTILQSDFAFWLAMRLARRAMIENILGTPSEVAANASPAERERLQSTLMSILPVSRRREGLLNDGAVVSNLKRFELEKVEAPTLAISLEDDRYGTLPGAKDTAEQIRDARFIGFPTGGHLWLGHSGEVSAAVRDFLTGAVLDHAKAPARPSPSPRARSPRSNPD
jgi:pimeloyl-ACP methyl ester carboxylesterase